jgi:HEAT repeat protein
MAVIAAMSLGQIGDTTAVPALTAAYRSENPRLRYAVVAALSDLDDRRGDDLLSLASQDRDQTVRHKAQEALRDRDHDDD